MNKHFEDTQYYLKRAIQNAKKGLKVELEEIETRFRELTGRETEPEPSRLDQIRDDLARLETKAEGEVRDAIKKAREQLQKYRTEKTRTS